MSFQDIQEAINEIPAIDIHTHLGSGGMWQARDLTDILFYHWLGTELKNAGHADRLDLGFRERVQLAVPYCGAIRSTSNYWMFAGILRDLYGIEGGLTESNWEAAFDVIAERAEDQSWELEVLRRAKIEKAAVEKGCKPKDPSPYFNYAYAEPLYGVGLRSPDSLEKAIGRKVETARELSEALTETTKRLVEQHKIKALHVWLPANWQYTTTVECDIDGLLFHWMDGEVLSDYEQHCLASFSADVMAREAAKYGLVVQLFHGSIAYGGGPQVSTWHPDFLRTAILHMASHPDTPFDLFLATRNASHEAAGMARQYPNLMVSGGWWHGFTPTTLTEFFRDRLEMLPMTRWSAFYSDGYCVEWCYGKLLLAKNRLAVALSQLVDEGLIGESDVEPIARAVLYDNPKRVYLGE